MFIVNRPKSSVKSDEAFQTSFKHLFVLIGILVCYIKWQKANVFIYNLTITHVDKEYAAFMQDQKIWRLLIIRIKFPFSLIVTASRCSSYSLQVKLPI